MEKAMIHAIKTRAGRFWGKVAAGGDDECWEWTGEVDRQYGKLFAFGRAWTAHRLAYHMAVGTVVRGQRVQHRCKNKLCCNPAHLYLPS